MKDNESQIPQPPPLQEIAKLEMLGAQFVRYSFAGGSPTFGSPHESIYGMKDSLTDAVTVFCVKDSEARSVDEIITQYSVENATKRFDWWIGTSTTECRKSLLRADLESRGFVKQTGGTMYDLWSYPKDIKTPLAPSTSTIDMEYDIQEVVYINELKERWLFLGESLAMSENVIKRGFEGEKLLAFGPGTDVRHFVARRKSDRSIIGSASISFFEGVAYVFFVAAKDDGVSTALVLYIFDMQSWDPLRKDGTCLIGIDTRDVLVKERYEQLGFKTLPFNIEGYVWKGLE
ncbi:UNVERIFIED_CONTAM: hypothetical protein HDU68_012906 [Siphonaria sp. JEL0065]|nr:hypothetical protein HDU68_012906 [Siphonaria sp. JEL0065]